MRNLFRGSACIAATAIVFSGAVSACPDLDEGPPNGYVDVSNTDDVIFYETSIYAGGFSTFYECYTDEWGEIEGYIGSFAATAFNWTGTGGFMVEVVLDEKSPDIHPKGFVIGPEDTFLPILEGVPWGKANMPQGKYMVYVGLERPKLGEEFSLSDGDDYQTQLLNALRTEAHYRDATFFIRRYEE
ncbi:hypothetical protein G5B38_11150 [Pseudohalocynthiibacter aestuariivivens]|uniref:DUF4185 domain-containing protein n=1 Tax=Roseovarius pelagicus TaxID=2980108 RepID=A0ABY6D8R6_9RHOB|nr:hypothetical protein [Pseudohalocynthiibacter aestuariivivens]QIE46034.1 hypothetical protein G5B38_11150 [Pseudohalocynthiibacter aestuariivivens]UXX82005.1 hypothetical protein N7U68_12865 [Roseovarius pelagicus]